MDRKEPIKRTEELAPLSREHHEGLLFAWKIRQGLRNGTGTGQIGDYIQWYGQHHLDPHFKEEEVLLVPNLPAGNAMIRQMLEEHKAIRSMLAASEWTSETIESLAAKIHNHIRFEERLLFPFIEKELSPAQLSSIYQGLMTSEPSRESWQNEFWLKK